MIRVLLMIAAAGFVLSVGSLSAAIAIGGPEAVTQGGWKLLSSRSHWDGDRSSDSEAGGSSNWGDEATRTIAWTGGDSLDVDLPADVRYVQAPGDGTVTITGPRKAIERVVLRGGELGFDGRRRHAPKLTIVIRAPAISTFDLSGSNGLAIEGYRQPKLRIDASGSADIVASGETDELDLDLSGSAAADLGALRSREARVDIAGSADAVIAPTEAARLDVSGQGDVRLVTQPKVLESDVSGSGRVRQTGPETPSVPSSPSRPTP